VGPRLGSGLENWKTGKLEVEVEVEVECGVDGGVWYGEVWYGMVW
jgi:hypothetical protein